MSQTQLTRLIHLHSCYISSVKSAELMAGAARLPEHRRFPPSSADQAPAEGWAGPARAGPSHPSAPSPESACTRTPCTAVRALISANNVLFEVIKLLLSRRRVSVLVARGFTPTCSLTHLHNRPHERLCCKALVRQGCMCIRVMLTGDKA